MNIHCGAAAAALMFLPALAAAQEAPSANDEAADEIVVVGRSVTTGSASVEVQREFLVDTATVLREIPGATVNQNGLITGIAQYRGMYGDRVAVNIDQLGVVSGGPNAMDTPLSYASPMMTEELVLSRGIASVSLAPEAIGGHISAKTSRGDFGDDVFRLSGVLGTRFSSNGNVSTSTARATLADKQHRFSAVVERDDGKNLDTPEGQIRPSGINRDRYDLSYAYADEVRQLMIYAGNLDTRKSGTPALPMDILVIDTDLFGTTFAFDVSPQLLLEGRFSYNDVYHVMNNYSLRQAPMPAMQRVNTASGSGSHFFLAGTSEQKNARLVLGVDGNSAQHDSVIINPNNAMFEVNNFTDVDRDLLGVFAEWSRTIEHGEVEVGLRYNRVDTHAGIVGASGMMGMMGMNVGALAAAFNSANRDLSWTTLDGVVKYRWAFSDAVDWNVEFGRKSRAPSYQELYLWLPLQATGGLADGRTYIGNLGLREEKSNEIVLGLSADVGRLVWSPQVFYRRIYDYIQGTPSTNMLANMVSTMMTGREPLQFANIDAEIWGFDAAWKYELTENLFLDGIVTIVRGRRTDADDDLYRLSPFNASIGLSYGIDDWMLKSELAGYADQDRVAAYNGETETPGYWLVNFELVWNPLSSLRIGARIDNVLDESYQDHVTGINRAGGSDISVGTRSFGAERTLSAGLIYSF